MYRPRPSYSKNVEREAKFYRQTGESFEKHAAQMREEEESREMTEEETKRFNKVMNLLRGNRERSFSVDEILKEVKINFFQRQNLRVLSALKESEFVKAENPDDLNELTLKYVPNTILTVEDVVRVVEKVFQQTEGRPYNPDDDGDSADMKEAIEKAINERRVLAFPRSKKLPLLVPNPRDLYEPLKESDCLDALKAAWNGVDMSKFEPGAEARGESQVPPDTKGQGWCTFNRDIPRQTPEDVQPEASVKGAAGQKSGGKEPRKPGSGRKKKNAQ